MTRKPKARRLGAISTARVLHREGIKLWVAPFAAPRYLDRVTKAWREIRPGSDEEQVLLRAGY